jgi:hypothetical protein
LTSLHTRDLSHGRIQRVGRAMNKTNLKILSAGLLLALQAAYSNHFHNSLHFDDAHTIEINPHIRDLANILKFFTDASALK